METIDTADWRIDTVTTLAKDWVSPWTYETFPIGTVIKKSTISRINRKQTLSVTIPNASALLLNIGRRAFAAAVAIRRDHVPANSRRTELFIGDEEGFAYLEHMFEAVICSHTAVEAFVNESLPTDLTYRRSNRKGIVEEMGKDEIERRATLLEKVEDVLPQALGKTSPRGIHRAYSDLQALTKIRDRLIHMKSEDRKSSGPDTDTIWHRLLACDSPVDQAMSVIKYFAPPGENCPRWLSKMPKR